MSFMLKQKINSHLLYSAIILLLTTGIFWNALQGDFIWDDRGLIVDNTAYLNDLKNVCAGFVKPFFTDAPYYRPLLTASFVIDYQMWGTNPFGYHFTNLIIHIVNALLVYIFIFILFKRDHLALLTSLLFTAHPIQSEAVAWISGRNDLILTFFALLVIILHLRWTHLQGWRGKFAYACYMLSYAGAILSKESAVVLPLLVMLIDCFFPDRGRTIVRDYAGMLFITVLYYFVKQNVIGATGVELHEREVTDMLAAVLVTYAYYFRMLLFPFFQSAVPVITASGAIKASALIGSLSLMAILSTGAIICLKRHKEMSFVFLWVLISLLPVCGIVPLAIPALEHRLYLGTVCFSMLLPCAVCRLRVFDNQSWHCNKANAIVFLLIPALLIFYSAKTVTRNAVWENELSFWMQTARDSSRSATARNNLGIVYARSGNYHMAISELKKAVALIEQERIFNAGHSHVQLGKLFNNLGQSYYQLLQQTMADEACVSPSVPDDDTNSERNCNEIQRFYALSRFNYQRSLRADPVNAEVHNNLGDLFYVMKNYPAAEAEYRKALQLNPNLAEYYNNLGLTYYEMKNYDGAQENLNRAITLQPNFLEARNNMALVYMHRGWYHKALKELEMALSSGPDNAGVYFNLAMVYLRGFDDGEQARFYFKKYSQLNRHHSHGAAHPVYFSDQGKGKSLGHRPSMQADGLALQ